MFQSVIFFYKESYENFGLKQLFEISFCSAAPAVVLTAKCHQMNLIGAISVKLGLPPLLLILISQGKLILG